MEEIWNERAKALLDWYARCGRVLPWRINQNPYRVWVSEIMLQQTRVETVIPYYHRFMATLPDVQTLATAEDDQLYKLWEGLGYYSRVRNMKKAARLIVDEFDGIFPNEPQQLMALPGFGPYTVGAVASIAFGKPAAAVDGNVLRVLARMNNDGTDISTSGAKKSAELQLLPVLREVPPGTFNQAMMDLGAMICLPNGEPDCEHCPLEALCEGKKAGRQNQLPVKAPKRARRKESYTVFLILADGKVAFRRRSSSGLLAELWEYPNVPGFLTEEQTREQLKRWRIDVVSVQKACPARHIFTHIEWAMDSCLILAEQPSGMADWLWISVEQIPKKIALPSAFRAFTEYLFRER